MAGKIFVTRNLPGRALDRLSERYEVEIYPGDSPIPGEELLKKVKGKDGLIPLLTDKVDKAVMDRGDNLKVISNYAVGYDNIDVEEATKRGIVVTNTPGVLTDATAELGWALLLTCARRTAEGDKFCRQGKYKGWSPTLLLGMELQGKTLGIIGAGRIGTEFVKKGSGFGLKTLYSDEFRNEYLEQEFGAKRVKLETLLREADIVSVHVPLIPSTLHLIGERELKIMKRTAILINTSRGPVIDEKELRKALKEREIRGAGLDVYENEPEIPKELAELENVVLLPHIGSATEEARVKMADLAVENMLAALEGKRPPNLVNPEVFRE